MGVVEVVVDWGGGVGRPARHIVSIFEANQRGLRIIINFGANDGFDICPIEDSVIASGDAWHAASNCGHGSKFVQVDVAALFANDLVAVMGPNFYGDKVAHATTGNEEGGFFAEDSRGAGFERVHGGIFEIDVVADFDFGHGLAHGRRRARDRVAAQVDDVGYALW